MLSGLEVQTTRRFVQKRLFATFDLASPEMKSVSGWGVTRTVAALGTPPNGGI
jgi:hypothetical protein